MLDHRYAITKIEDLNFKNSIFLIVISGNKNTKHVRNFWFRQTFYRIIIIIIIIIIMIRRRRRRRIKKVKAISLKHNRSVYETFSLFVCWKQMVYIYTSIHSSFQYEFMVFFFFFFFSRGGMSGIHFFFYFSIF